MYISAGGGLHSLSLSNSQDLYDIFDSRNAASNFNFSALFRIDSTDKNISFYAGPSLQYDKVDCFIQFADFRNSVPLVNSDLDTLVIYGNGIVERNTFRSLALGCDFKAERVSKRGVTMAFSLIPYFRLPFTISSSLTDGTFNYRGRLDSIDEEIVSLPELGLEDGVTTDNYKTIENTYGGFGLVSKFSIGFENRGHGFRISPFFGFDKFTSKRLVSDDNRYISSYVNGYNSTWNSTGTFTLVKYGISVDYVYKFKMK
jgi:hypothetical protein